MSPQNRTASNVTSHICRHRRSNISFLSVPRRRRQPWRTLSSKSLPSLNPWRRLEVQRTGTWWRYWGSVTYVVFFFPWAVPGYQLFTRSRVTLDHFISHICFCFGLHGIHRQTFQTGISTLRRLIVRWHFRDRKTHFHSYEINTLSMPQDTLGKSVFYPSVDFWNTNQYFQSISLFWS